MAYTVAPSFDYAEFCVDYKTKDIKLNYPYTSGKGVDFWMFFFVGLIPCIVITIFISFLLDFFFGTFTFGGWAYSFEYSTWFIGAVVLGLWIVFSYRKTYIRQYIIELGKTSVYDNQVYLSGITGKRFKITNAGNYFTEYKLYGDYKKYIEKFEIKCVKCDKPKGFMKDWKGAKFVWELHFAFSQLPKKGHMLVYNERGHNDEVIGDNAIDVVYY